eukprot:Selendium_serpulae@DN4148_c0_g1_i1.p1
MSALVSERLLIEDLLEEYGPQIEQLRAEIEAVQGTGTNDASPTSHATSITASNDSPSGDERGDASDDNMNSKARRKKEKKIEKQQRKEKEREAKKERDEQKKKKKKKKSTLR